MGGPRPRFDSDLRRQSSHSVGWSIVRFMSDQFFAFVVFAVLARILPVADIGAFAIMVIMTQIFRAISTAGLIQVVAREPVMTDRFRDTVHRGNVVLSVAACAGVVLVAWPLSWLMDAPQMVLPLQVLSLTLPISALGMTHMALRLREFGYRTTALRSVVGGLVGGTAAITAAVGGLGLWALVIQRLVSETVGMILSRRSYRWKPGDSFSWDVVQRNVGLNGSLMASNLVTILMLRLQELVIGSMIGLAAAGLYRTAWRTVELVSNGAIRPFTTVAMQTFARVKQDPAQLERAYRWMLSRGAIISFPALAGFGAVATLAVPTIFGEKWTDAGPLAQAFAFMAVPFTLNFYASPALGAAGASRSLLVLTATSLVLTASFTFIAAPFGLMAVAWAYVLRAYVTTPLQILLLKRVASIGFGCTWNAVRAPFIASTVMAVLIHYLLPVTARLAASPWPRLMLLLLVGAAVYVALLAAFSSELRTLMKAALERLPGWRRPTN